MELRKAIQTVRANLAEAGKARYVTGTTTSAGNSTGTTVVASELNAFLDDHFVGAFLRLTSGNGNLQKRVRITDFVQSTGTVTVAETLGVQVDSGVSFEIFDEGIYSDVDILEWLNAEQEELVDSLSNDAAATLIKRASTNATAGFGGGTTAFAPLPSDAVRIVSAEISHRAVAILSPQERSRFTDDPFLFGNDPVGIYCQDGSTAGIELRPNSNATVKWTYIPRFTTMSLSSQNLSTPDHLADLVILGATARALRASGDMVESREFETKKMTRIKMINELTAGKYKLEY